MWSYFQQTECWMSYPCTVSGLIVGTWVEEQYKYCSTDMLLRKTKENTSKTIQDDIWTMFYLLFILFKHSFPAPDNFGNNKITNHSKILLKDSDFKFITYYWRRNYRTVFWSHYLMHTVTFYLRKIGSRICIKILNDSFQHRHVNISIHYFFAFCTLISHV